MYRCERVPDVRARCVSRRVRRRVQSDRRNSIINNIIHSCCYTPPWLFDAVRVRRKTGAWVRRRPSGRDATADRARTARTREHDLVATTVDAIFFGSVCFSSKSSPRPRGADDFRDASLRENPEAMDAGREA